MLFLLNTLLRSVSNMGFIEKYIPPRPVVSVGNIGFGGTGKTPHVIYIADELVRSGKKVCILSRGYRRKSRGTHFVDEGDYFESHDIIGDEPCLIKSRVPGAMICVGADRRKSIESVLIDRDVDFFVMDDGFQQFFIEKSLDLVLIRYKDLDSLGFPGSTLSMREPPASLKNADLIVVTKAPLNYDLSKVVRVLGSYGKATDCIVSKYRLAGFVDNRGSGLSFSKGERFFLFAGIADFDGLQNTVEEYGYEISGKLAFPDHVEYGDDHFDKIVSASDGVRLLTTEKDLVKLPYDRFGTINAMSIEVDLVEGKELLLNRIGELDRKSVG